MDFEEKVAKNIQKKPHGISRIRQFLELDWKSKVRVALPLSIYIIFAALLFKVIYEELFGKRRIFKTSTKQNLHVSPSEEDENVCF